MKYVYSVEAVVSFKDLIEADSEDEARDMIESELIDSLWENGIEIFNKVDIQIKGE